MTAIEFLKQAHRLQYRINLQQQRIDNWKEMMTSIPSPSLGEHYNPNHSTHAPYEKIVEKIMLEQEKAEERMEQLLILQEQIQNAIDELEDSDEAAILEERYVNDLSWVQIADKMYLGEKTIRRIHKRALENIKIPEFYKS